MDDVIGVPANVIVIFAGLAVETRSGIRKGGAEIYTMELCRLTTALGCQTTLIQFGQNPCVFRTQYANVVTCKWLPNLVKRHPARQIRKLLSKFRKQDTLVVFTSEAAVIKLKGYRTVLIQHGIGFDYPTSGSSLGFLSWLRVSWLAQMLVRRSAFQVTKSVDLIVAVDYVYPIWFRTFQPIPSRKIITIPNFVRLPGEAPSTRRSFRRVIFARRLVRRRGVQQFADAISKILPLYPNLIVTIAGDGEYKSVLEQQFEREERVRFVVYEPEDAVSVHIAQDIAVVPSIASEGTSLSALQAMAAKCVLICSGVGGLSNIVINNHNGLICDSSVESLAIAIKKVLDDPNLGYRLSNAGYQTVVDSFSYERWMASWTRVFGKMSRHLGGLSELS